VTIRAGGDSQEGVSCKRVQCVEGPRKFSASREKPCGPGAGIAAGLCPRLRGLKKLRAVRIAEARGVQSLDLLPSGSLLDGPPDRDVDVEALGGQLS
jgi:hypothetical protein